MSTERTLISGKVQDARAAALAERKAEGLADGEQIGIQKGEQIGIIKIQVRMKAEMIEKQESMILK